MLFDFSFSEYNTCWIVELMNELTARSELNQPGQRELNAAETLEESIGEFYECGLNRVMMTYLPALLRGSCSFSHAKT